MDSDVCTASCTFQIIFTSIWCKKKKKILTAFATFYYSHSPLRGHCAYNWFVHDMNSKTLIPISELYLFLPHAACWAAGSWSAAAWQVIGIKELRDLKVVVRQWFDTFLRSFCQIFLWHCKQAGVFGSVLSLWVCGWSLIQPGWWGD